MESVQAAKKVQPKQRPDQTLDQDLCTPTKVGKCAKQTDEMDWSANADTAPSETKNRFFDTWTDATQNKAAQVKDCERAPRRLCESRASDLTSSHGQADGIVNLVNRLSVLQPAKVESYDNDKYDMGRVIEFNEMCLPGHAEYLRFEGLSLQNQFSYTSAAPTTPKRSKQECPGMKKRREASIFPSPVSQRESAMTSSPMGNQLDRASFRDTEKSQSDQKVSESSCANFLELR